MTIVFKALLTIPNYACEDMTFTTFLYIAKSQMCGVLVSTKTDQNESQGN